MTNRIIRIKSCKECVYLLQEGTWFGGYGIQCLYDKNTFTVEEDFDGDKFHEIMDMINNGEIHPDCKLEVEK